MTDYSYDLSIALTICDHVDELTLRYFRDPQLVVESKPDSTPVSEADRGAERIIRHQLSRTHPNDAVYGEEYGAEGSSRRRWIIDPIDGTKNYVRGVPVWATLIGLEEDGRMVAGVVSAPALGRRWWAREGGGAWSGAAASQGRRLRVSDIATIGEASLSTSSDTAWEDEGREEDFVRLRRSVAKTRGYGDFWSYLLVAEGAVDIATEPDLELYDMAALVPIVVEAGGSFTDVSGTIEGPWGANALASNGVLHREAIAILRGGSAEA